MKRLILRIILCLSIFTGLCLILYPTISNIVNALTNNSTINSYNENVKSYNTESIELMCNEAKEYNKVIADKYTSEDSTNEIDIFKSYNTILNLGDGLMGYIEIPEINVNLPIYHGGDEDVLTKGAVHLEKTSLPVGGKSTHAVISAHSGYPTQKFFDDIDELQNDSLIYIHTLNMTLTYKVYSTEVVDPNDSSKLNVIDGKDIMSLVTCYPYGINSHRLLIHAERIYDTENAASIDETSSSKRTYDTSVLFLIVILLFLAIFAFLAVKYIKHSKNKKALGGENK